MWLEILTTCGIVYCCILYVELSLNVLGRDGLENPDANFSACMMFDTS